ncbi:MAG: T9SS type A sorting domain-containing protein [Bacteroidetes bacterium]|nr:T9SS type A sorting domain-containing protein [Bacteroidota bacterium]
MNVFYKFFSVLITFVILNNSNAQGVAIGQWRDHLSYNTGISLAEADLKIYCASASNLFCYDRNEKTITRLTKDNGISDVGISKVAFSKHNNILVVGYTNANVDLIENNTLINISDIKRKNIPGNKTINSIMFIGDYAYLACGFGIVVLDLSKKEIKETYYIGVNGTQLNINDLANDGTKIYAATDDGIYYANLSNNNLADYNSWNKFSNIGKPNAKYNLIECFNNKIFVNKPLLTFNSDSIFVYNGTNWSLFDSVNHFSCNSMKVYYNKLVIAYAYSALVFNTDLQVERNVWTYSPESPMPRDAILDRDMQVWLADTRYSLVRYVWDGDVQKISPNGPGTNNVFSMAALGGNLWVAPGGRDDSWGPVWNNNGLFHFSNENWKTINGALDTITDFVSIAIDPLNNKRAFAGSWAKGMVEMIDGQFVKLYNETNSPLIVPPQNGSYYWIGVGGVKFDNDGNLWVTNSGVNTALSVMKTDGTWNSFNFSGLLYQNTIGDLVIDKMNQKWVILGRGDGILVFNDNNTISNIGDDKSKRLNAIAGSGGLPSNNVLCMACDKDGEIWVGTDKGIAVFYNPENVFSTTNFDAQQIIVELDSTAQLLMGAETVTCIAVDGSNKKWIGTESGGVFQVSADGVTEIHHFFTENSPLLSNSITSIAVDDISGEVFFGTQKGIVSYKGNATEGNEDFTDVYAYPNPVKENYNGVIGIKGLVSNVDVKITDISGNLVYSTKAEGGQAIWNGKNFKGERVKAGVYMVFCANEDGSKKYVTKIMVLN